MADKFLNLTGLSYFWGKIKSVYSYAIGDTVTIESGKYIEVAGQVGTGNNPYLYFTIPLSKEISSSVSGVTFTNLKILVRGIEGNIISPTSEIIGDTTYTVVTYVLHSTSSVTVRIAGATTGIVARTPIIVEVSDGTSFTFS